MNSQAIIELSGANIYQQDKLILNNVSFTLNRGEFAYLIGKTGTGKTSLLKTLYGILPLNNGIGRVAGFDLRTLNRKNIPFLRRKTGFIFQDFVLLKDRSVDDNLLFAMQATGWTEEQKMRDKIVEVLTRVGMRHIDIRKRPHELSGGEQQRLVIARAMLNNPELIIADEATGNLDPETSEEIVNLLIDLSQKQETSVLFATHNYRLLEQFPARIIKCENGQLLDRVEMTF